MGRSAAHVKAHSDISVRDTPRIVAFVTLGQSPRVDLVPEILDSIKIPIKTIEYGLLDDLDHELIASLSPEPGEPAFLTHLRDGRQVELATSWAYRRFREVYEKIRQDDADLVVLMSTTCGHDFRPDYLAIGELRRSLGVTMEEIEGEALFHVDGTPREDYVADIAIEPASTAADGSDPGIARALEVLESR